MGWSYLTSVIKPQLTQRRRLGGAVSGNRTALLLGVGGTEAIGLWTQWPVEHGRAHSPRLFLKPGLCCPPKFPGRHPQPRNSPALLFSPKTPTCTAISNLHPSATPRQPRCVGVCNDLLDLLLPPIWVNRSDCFFLRSEMKLLLLRCH